MVSQSDCVAIVSAVGSVSNGKSDKLFLFCICHRSNGCNFQIKRIIVFMKWISLIKVVYRRLANRTNNFPVSVLVILQKINTPTLVKVHK